MSPEIMHLSLLLALTFVGGMLNASIGGGGLVLLPGMFNLYPQALPAQLFATEKCASVVGQGTAAWRYAKQIKLPWKLLLLASSAAFCGAHLGARTIYLLPAQWIKPFVVLLLILMLIYTWFKPDFGTQDSQKAITRTELIRGLLIGTAIGFYEGFFGPGAGSFLIFLFVRVFHFDFLRASACAKVVNMSTNLGALAFFIPKGLVNYHLALPMIAAMMAGAWFGSHLAMTGGNLWLRRLFLLLTVVMIGKLGWDLLL